ncbi:MAG: hypothetical protein H0V63_04420, partial [Burkholderiaceae bacterium]|nr:hypothetical protein [Burkholderiaceae bacterium]
MKASFKSSSAAAEPRVARAGRALAVLLAGALIATTAVAAQSVFAVAGGEPLVDKHDFINTEKFPQAGNTVELERLFWMCDYAATVETLDAHEVEMCAAVTERLRLVNFDDDFDRLLA